MHRSSVCVSTLLVAGMLAGCGPCRSDQSYWGTSTRTNRYFYTQTGVDEHRLVADLRDLSQQPATIAISDYRQGDTVWLEIETKDPIDLVLRDRVLDLKYTLVHRIPVEARFISRHYGPDRGY